MTRERWQSVALIGFCVIVFVQGLTIQRLKNNYVELKSVAEELRKSTPVVVAEDGSGVTLPIEAKEGDVLQFTFNGKAWETEWKTEDLARSDKVSSFDPAFLLKWSLDNKLLELPLPEEPNAVGLNTVDDLLISNCRDGDWFCFGTFGLSWRISADGKTCEIVKDSL